jgi:hypothetical protein
MTDQNQNKQKLVLRLFQAGVHFSILGFIVISSAMDNIL